MFCYEFLKPPQSLWQDLSGLSLLQQNAAQLWLLIKTQELVCEASRSQNSLTAFDAILETCTSMSLFPLGHMCWPLQRGLCARLKREVQVQNFTLGEEVLIYSYLTPSLTPHFLFCRVSNPSTFSATEVKVLQKILVVPCWPDFFILPKWFWFRESTYIYIK